MCSMLVKGSVVQLVGGGFRDYSLPYPPRPSPRPKNQKKKREFSDFVNRMLMCICCHSFVYLSSHIII